MAAELEAAVVPVVCFNQKVFQFLCYDSYTVIILYIMQWHAFHADTTQARQRVKCRTPATAMQYAVL